MGNWFGKSPFLLLVREETPLGLKKRNSQLLCNWLRQIASGNLPFSFFFANVFLFSLRKEKGCGKGNEFSALRIIFYFFFLQTVQRVSLYLTNPPSISIKLATTERYKPTPGLAFSAPKKILLQNAMLTKAQIVLRSARPPSPRTPRPM